MGSLLRLQIVHGKVEDVTLPEKADILISEPMGEGPNTTVLLHYCTNNSVSPFSKPGAGCQMSLYPSHVHAGVARHKAQVTSQTWA